MASDRPTGGAHGWLKSAAGRATGSELRTRKSLIRLDFIEHKSERSVMPQDIGVGRNVVLDGLDFASLRRVWEQTFICRTCFFEWVRASFPPPHGPVSGPPPYLGQTWHSKIGIRDECRK